MVSHKWARILSVVLVILVGAWFANRNSGVEVPVAEHSVPRAPQEAAPVPVRGEDGPTPVQAEPAVASESAGSAETVVRVAAAVDPSLEAQAMAFLAQPSGSDVGINTIRKALQSALQPPAELDPFVEPMPSVDELRQNRDYNPARAELGGEDLRVLEELIAEYGAKLRSAKRDVHLADRLALAEAIQNGDFVTKPNGSDPDGIGRKLRAEAQARNPDGRWLSGELPGSDFSHNRFVLLEQSRYPAFFAAQDAIKLQRAEFEIAVRSIFLAAARSRR